MIFLTGATGFIGSYILRDLLKKGYSVKAIKRSNSTMPSDLQDIQGLQWVDCDILDHYSLSKHMEGCSEVIHTAAIVSFNPREREEMFRVNVEGTKNIVNACIDVDVNRLVYVSSVAALGKDEKEKTITEETKWVTADGRAAYDVSKYNAELEVWRGREEGLLVNVVNPSVVLGFGDWNRSSSQLFKQVYTMSKFYTDGFINYVDVRDVSTAVVKLLGGDVVNERFILCGGRLSYLEFFTLVAKAFEITPPSIKVPMALLNIWWRLEKTKSVVTGISPLITKETVSSLRRSFNYSNEKAKQLLDLKFTDVNETIHWSVKRYVNKYELR